MQIYPLLLRLPPPLFSDMVRTVWPSQYSGSPHSMMVELQSTTPSLSVQASVQSPPVEQVFQSLCPTMWYTLSVLWPPTALGTVVLQWRPSELVYIYIYLKCLLKLREMGSIKFHLVSYQCIYPLVAFTAPLLLFSGWAAIAFHWGHCRTVYSTLWHH